jgi:hypothetical protein
MNNMKKIIFGGIIVLALLITVMSALAAAPTVTLSSPADGNTYGDTDVTFAYVVSDSDVGASIVSCSLLLNGTVNGAPDLGVTMGVNTFDRTLADETTYGWNVECTDNDADTGTAAADFTLPIHKNDAPQWIANIPDQSVQEDSGATELFDVTAWVVDPDTSDTITFTVQTEDTSKVNCAVDSDGNDLTITPAANFAGTSSCTIRASDGALHVDDSFQITVANTQDAPTISGIPDATMVEGTQLEIDLDDYSDDIDGDSLSYTVDLGGSSLLAETLTGDNLELESDTGTGTVNVEVTVSDGQDQATDSFIVTIRAPQTQLTTPSSLKLGGSNQDRGDEVDGSFVIQNPGVTGDTTLTNLKVSFDPESGYDGNVTFSTSATGTYATELSLSNLAPGQSQTIYVKAYISEDAYGGVSNAGKIKVESTEKSDSFDLDLETELKLKFKDLDITVDEGDDNNIQNEDDGYVIDKEAIPGTEIEISFKLENTFSESSDTEITDIEVEITLEDMGDESEQDETIEVEDLDADEYSDSYTVTFDIPYQLDEDKYELTFEVEGIDENDAKHRFTKNFKINVVKESHDLTFKATLTPETVTCSNSAELEVEVFNIGDKDEDDIDVIVTSTNLGIDLRQEIDTLDNNWDDDDNNEKLTFTIDVPEGTDAGNYPIKIELYRDNKDEKEGSKSYTLKVEECTTSTTTDDDDDTGITIIDTPTTTDDTTTVDDSTVDITDSLETPFLESGTFIVLLIIAIVVVIALIVLLLMLGMRR